MTNYDSDYEVRLAELSALGGDTHRNFDSVYEIDLAILDKIQGGGVSDMVINDNEISYVTTFSSAKLTQMIADAGFNVAFVDSLPLTGDIHTIYFVPSTHPVTGNEKDEFMWNASAAKWEQVGSTSIDLSPYATISYVNTEDEAVKNAAYSYTNTEVAAVKALAYAYTNSEVTAAKTLAYAYSSSLDAATRQWVSDAAYLQQHQDLSAYATISYVNSEDSNIKDLAYSYAGSLDSATRQWVINAAYLQQHQDLSAYATISYVNSEDSNIKDLAYAYTVAGLATKQDIIDVATNSDINTLF